MSKQTRGASANMMMPFRMWLSEPAGSVPSTARASLLKLGADPAPGSPSGAVFFRRSLYLRAGSRGVN